MPTVVITAQEPRASQASPLVMRADSPPAPGKFSSPGQSCAAHPRSACHFGLVSHEAAHPPTAAWPSRQIPEEEA